MAKKPFFKSLNSFREEFIAVTSPTYPAFTVPWIVTSISLAICQLTSEYWLGIAAVGLVFAYANFWSRSKIEIKHDLIHVNTDSPNRMNRYALKLNQGLKVEERIDKNPILARKIGVYNDGQYVTLHGMGTSRELTPKGVLVLAELQRLGANVSFPGFRDHSQPMHEGEHDLAVRLLRVEALVAMFPIYVSLALLIPTLLGQIPWITPFDFLLGFIPWLIYLIFWITSGFFKEKTYAKTTNDKIEICLRRRFRQEVPWEEIKQILTTVHPSKLMFESVSVHLVTHYNRTHTLVDRELVLVRGVLDIVDLARSKGIGLKVIYQSKEGETDVFLDSKPKAKVISREQVDPAEELNLSEVERA